MPQRNPIDYIVRLELLGFGLIILLTWLDELLDLPSLLFGGTHYSDYHEAALETVITLAVAVPVIFLTRKLLQRLHYLEEFLRVCAWCRKVDHDGHWLPLEEYFQRRFNTLTTHGMCPECFAKTRHGLGEK